MRLFNKISLKSIYIAKINILFVFTRIKSNIFDYEKKFYELINLIRNRFFEKSI